MDCSVAACPHRRVAGAGCPFAAAALSVRNAATGLALHPVSLVVASLEIGRVLADRGKVAFRAQGTCMFPCVKPGDVMQIEPRAIERVQIGDIAVFRRDAKLFGHRVVAKGTDNTRPSIVTRPDRTQQGDDGPTHGDDVLGVVTSIERRGAPMPLHPQTLHGSAALCVRVWEWWRGRGRAHLLERVGVWQGSAWYRHLAAACWRVVRPRLSYVVRVPFNAVQPHDLYREVSPDAFDVSQPAWHGKPVTRWTLAVSIHAESTPAATATLVLHPPGCPRGSGWRVEDVRSRLRYRHTGLENALLGQVQAILARSGLVRGGG